MTSRFAVLILAALVVCGCRHAPPGSSPRAHAAFQGTQVIKTLDLLRDYATDANAQVPPLISTVTTRKIVIYHRSAITTIHDIPNGWKPTVLTGLDEVQKNLPPDDASKVAPYVALIKAVIAEVK